ncbi:hypothetical protein IHE45_05G094400 [Dioscorea alata]|uniref:Uncharacterized protein n=1 Tax=Dioscorea alata TaxID=55571 RepID=A0ACB7W3Q7_DIOAL|nr:hypothetical protein IHE45_05G094400 [Dioscorea alata]
MALFASKPVYHFTRIPRSPLPLYLFTATCPHLHWSRSHVSLRCETTVRHVYHQDSHFSQRPTDTTAAWLLTVRAALSIMPTWLLLIGYTACCTMCCRTPDD